MRCLLDKVTARYTVQGLLKLAEGRDLTLDEVAALDFFSLGHPQKMRLFIVPHTANILQRLSKLPHYGAIIHLFLAQTQVIIPSRYFKRWSRRLRDYEFTNEDAAVLALATFGTNAAKNMLGVNVVVTFDQPMIDHWATQQTAIQKRLQAMQKDISAPYHHAKLPQVSRPEQIGL